jgi:DNA topoisomerase-2
VHKEHNIYVPELVFGHLLTGTNFDDEEKKVTGGRNGFGAKLTNIYSKMFCVECGDSKRKKRFKMVWNNNMSSKSLAEIREYKGEDFVKVTFIPDYERFNLPNGLDENHLKIFKKRIYDLAGVIEARVKISYNQSRIMIKDFSEYVNYYLGPGAVEMKEKGALKKQQGSKSKDGLNGEDDDMNAPIPEDVYKICEKSHRWEVIVAQSDHQFQQVSFVNGICTTRGGNHVSHIVDQICQSMIKDLEKKNKKLKLKHHNVKNHLWVFINCQIENPAFDSQTKEKMTLKISAFGSKCELTDKFYKKLSKTGIEDNILFHYKMKEDAQMQRKLKGKRTRLTGVAKLEDANMAGKKDAELCTLILTEGDSAKSLAMSGMEIIGRDNYGVFPLKGKFLNVRDATNKQIMENAEVTALIKIIGLQLGKVYEDKKSLRYGSVMIMADQDADGSHIKGLVINFFHKFWPSLIHSNNFLREFVTPILKAKKGETTISFFTLNDFKGWAEPLGDDIKKWKIKYYKGLGTSTDKEAKEYFSALRKHRLDFVYEGIEDDQAIDLVFNKRKADDRKIWLRDSDPEAAVDHNEETLTYNDFVHKELVHFSRADCMRAIPNILDGLKTSQRKILFSCFKRRLTGEIKVAQ